MAQPKLSAEDDYQGEWDANTLSDAELIKADPKRFAKAKKAAKALAKKKELEAGTMKKVAGNALTKPKAKAKNPPLFK